MSDEIRHFTAWLVNDRTCVLNGLMDLTVLEDKLIGDDPEDHGNWTTDSSKKEHPFYAETTVSVEDGDVADAMDEAEDLLEKAGWRMVDEWDITPNAYVVTVERVVD